MQFSFNTLDIILILSSGQGIFLGILILHKHRILLANRFLGILMIVYSIILFYLTFANPETHNTYPIIMGFLSALPFFIGPLHFLYAKYLIAEIRNIKPVDFLHFSFGIIYLLIIIIFALFFDLTTRNADSQDLPLRFLIFNWILVIHLLIYMTATLTILYRYARNIINVFSNIEKIKLNWLRNITILFIIGLSIFFIENVLLLANIRFFHFFDISSLIAAVMFYTLGYMGLLKSEIFSDPTIAESLQQISDLASVTTSDSAGKYSKSGLSESKAKTYQGRLNDFMKSKSPYTDSNLTLNKLANILGMTAHNLSEVINLHMRQNFFDFINKYRVEKVKQDLLDPEKKHLTFLAIAFDAGFNSKSSFNVIFKKHTGMTPSQYRNNIKK